MSLRRGFYNARGCLPRPPCKLFDSNKIGFIRFSSFGEVRLEEIADIRFARVVVKFI